MTGDFVIHHLNYIRKLACSTCFILHSFICGPESLNLRVVMQAQAIIFLFSPIH